MASQDILARAQSGDVNAQVTLAGQLNAEGRGREAMDWYARAADAGHPEAMVAMAFALGHGQFAEQDPKAAVRLLKNAVKAGHPFARQALAAAKVQGFGTAEDWEGAVDVIIAGAHSGLAPLMRQVGGLLLLAGEESLAAKALHVAAPQDPLALALLLSVLFAQGEMHPNHASAARQLMAMGLPLSPSLLKAAETGKPWQPPAGELDWKAVQKTLRRMPKPNRKGQERLADAPAITVYRNALPAIAGDYLRFAAGPRMRPAEIFDPEQGVHRMDPYRQANATTFAPLAQDVVTATLDRMIMKLADSPYENGEHLGVLSYAPGGQYRPHYDCFIEADGIPEVEIDSGGQRVRTALLIAEDEFEGGGTAFPRLGLSIRAEKGSVLVFDNVDEQGNPDDAALHAGETVTAGTKWIGSKWIRASAYKGT